MSQTLRLGQVLRGRLGLYTLTTHVQETVWLARNQAQQTVIVKFVLGHFRVYNERDVLRELNQRSPYVRPLLDEIEDPAEPVTIVLPYLEDDLLEASKKKSLSRDEIKYVCWRALKALSVIHKANYIHTDVKSNNVFVNYRDGKIRFAEVQLGDYGSTYHIDSERARTGCPIGAPVWRSPEALLTMPFGPATDIWSFGTMVISLILGGDSNIFRPKGFKFGDDEYEFRILMKQFQFFGPFPDKWAELVQNDEETFLTIMYLMEQIEEMTPFHRVVEREVCAADKEFICKIMKMDPRDRPTADDLLADEWFSRGPIVMRPEQNISRLRGWAYHASKPVIFRFAYGVVQKFPTRARVHRICDASDLCESFETEE